MGRIPVSSAREVIAALQDERMDLHQRLGTATWALPHGPGFELGAPTLPGRAVGTLPHLSAG